LSHEYVSCDDRNEANEGHPCSYMSFRGGANILGLFPLDRARSGRDLNSLEVNGKPSFAGVDRSAAGVGPERPCALRDVERRCRAFLNLPM
jgi:hypothetical protein